MDLKITWTCHLKDEMWGFSDLLNGRELNEETKEEIKDLVEEDIYDAIYTDGAMAIEADTGESNCTIHSVSNSLPTPEDIKRWHALLVGKGEQAMYDDMRQ